MLVVRLKKAKHQNRQKLNFLYNASCFHYTVQEEKETASKGPVQRGSMSSNCKEEFNILGRRECDGEENEYLSPGSVLVKGRKLHAKEGLC